MKFKHLIMEKEGFISTLYLNTPERLNPMTIESLGEMIDAVKIVSQDRDVRVLIVTGQGRGFCSGADMDVAQYIIDLGDKAQFRRILRDIYQRATNSVEQLEKPVIAAINGPAVGGGFELALACDFRIASENARFIFSEVKLGVIPDAGGIPRLTRLVGCGKAKEIIMTGRMIEGMEAERIGIVNRCVPADQLLSEAKHWAEQLIACAPLAVGVAKRMIDQTMDVDLMTALEMVGYAQSELWYNEDFQEGVKAFLEKRKPVFKGK